MTQQDQIDGEPNFVAGPTPSPMNKVAFASFIGTAIEFYDFYIYGTAAALIFPHVFVPNMASLGSWAVGLMIAFFVVVSIVCTALLPETKGAALERDAAVAC